MPLRLDTATIPVDHRVEKWAETMWELCSPMQVHTDPGAAFRARVVASDLGPLGLRHIVSDPYRGRQTRQTLGRERRESYILTLATQGAFHMSQFGREVVVDGKVATLHSTMDQVEFVHTAQAGALLLKIPAHLFRERVGLPEEYCAHALRIDNPTFRVACDFLLSLARNIGNLDHDTKAVMADRLLDVLAVALDAGNGQRSTGTTAVRHSRLQRIKEYIERHLSDIDLSSAQIAQANDVSERYLYELFRDENSTPGNWIRGRRLDSAHRALSDNRFGTIPVATIGLQRGFRNSAHFATAFRKRFGKSPLEIRQLTRKFTATDGTSFV